VSRNGHLHTVKNCETSNKFLRITTDCGETIKVRNSRSSRSARSLRNRNFLKPCKRCRVPDEKIEEFSKKTSNNNEVKVTVKVIPSAQFNSPVKNIQNTGLGPGATISANPVSPPHIHNIPEAKKTGVTAPTPVPPQKVKQPKIPKTTNHKPKQQVKSKKAEFTQSQKNRILSLLGPDEMISFSRE